MTTVAQMVAQSVGATPQPHNRPDIMAEAYRRGILPPQQAAAFEQAVHRGIITADPQTHALIDARANVRTNTAHMGVVGGALRSGGQGAAYGLIDEMAGKVNHGIVDSANFLHKATGGVVPGFPYSGDQMDAATVQATREDMAKFAQAHPVVDAASQLGGTLIAPGAMAGGRFIARGATLAARAGRSALVGGAIGAGQGAGNTQGGLAKRAVGAATGGTVGAIAGGTIPIATTVGAKVGRGVANVLTDTGRAAARMANGVPLNVTALPTPAESAAALRQVANVAKSTGRSGADLNYAAATGKPITVAEAIGRPAVTQAAAIARRAGTTGDNMNAAMAVRGEDAPSRIMSDFQDLTGITPSAAKGSIDDIVATGRARARPLYDAALASPDPVWSPELAKLATRPAIKDAMKQAYVDLRNAGQDPEGMGLAIDPDTGNPIAGDDLQAVTAFQPNAAAWDATKKAVAGLVEKDAFGHPLPDTLSSGNYGIRTANQDLTAALRDPDTGIPGYGDALDTSSDYLGLSSAFKRGQQLFSDPKVSATDFAAHMDGLGPSERDAFVGGVGSGLYGKAQQGLMTAKKLAVPVYADKLSAIMGDAAPDWADRLQMEADMAKTGPKMAPDGGSPTFGLANAAGEQDAQSIADATRMISQAKNDKLGLLANLWSRGADYGGTAGTTVGTRNALGDIYRSAPDSDIGQQLQGLLDQTQAQPRSANPITPAISGILGALTAQGNN